MKKIIVNLLFIVHERAIKPIKQALFIIINALIK